MPHLKALKPLDQAVTEPVTIVPVAIAPDTLASVSPVRVLRPVIAEPVATGPATTAPAEPAAAAPTAAAPVAPVAEVVPADAPEDAPVYVHYGGWDYIATTEMAGIFLRRAQQLIDDGESQLVPLRHSEGVELLYISAEVPFWVHDMQSCDLDDAPTGVRAEPDLDS